MNAHLVDDEVRELAEPIRGVLDPASPGDPGPVVGARPPERGLVDPVRLPEDLVAEAEGVEHLDRADRDAVGLAEAERAAAALDDPSVDSGELRELRGGGE